MEPGIQLAPWEPLTNWYDTKLEDILPHHGFVFKEGHKIFKAKQDWVRVKWAIEAPAPTLEEDKVDAVLAAIMNDANIISNTFQQTHFASIDYSRFPDGRFPHLMKKLIRARTLYNRITGILGRSEADKSKGQGKLATAIDEWTRTHPVDDPEPYYAQMPQYLKDLTDEDAPWVHTNYASNSECMLESMEDEEDENAPWIPWSQTMRARQLIRSPTKKECLLSYRM